MHKRVKNCKINFVTYAKTAEFNLKIMVFVYIDTIIVFKCNLNAQFEFTVSELGWFDLSNKKFGLFLSRVGQMVAFWGGLEGAFG